MQYERRSEVSVENIFSLKNPLFQYLIPLFFINNSLFLLINNFFLKLINRFYLYGNIPIKITNKEKDKRYYFLVFYYLLFKTCTG